MIGKCIHKSPVLGVPELDTPSTIRTNQGTTSGNNVKLQAIRKMWTSYRTGKNKFSFLCIYLRQSNWFNFHLNASKDQMHSSGPLPRPPRPIGILYISCANLASQHLINLHRKHHLQKTHCGHPMQRGEKRGKLHASTYNCGLFLVLIRNQLVKVLHIAMSKKQNIPITTPWKYPIGIRTPSDTQCTPCKKEMSNSKSPKTTIKNLCSGS